MLLIRLIRDSDIMDVRMSSDRIFTKALIAFQGLIFFSFFIPTFYV